MPQYLLTEKSQNDLRQIARYTNKRWGPQQRYKYLAQLKEGLKKVADNPGCGKECLALKGKPFRYHVGRHIIFYRPIAEGIEIIRILHEVMDHQRHL